MPPLVSRFLLSTAVAFGMLSLIAAQRLAGLFFALALLGSVITYQKIVLWRDERREWLRLHEQANKQHAAYLAGDDDWGVYGISPTAPTEVRA